MVKASRIVLISTAAALATELVVPPIQFGSRIGYFGHGNTDSRQLALEMCGILAIGALAFAATWNWR